MFLMRCLFTMFAEDVELLPETAFKACSEDCAAEPGKLQPMVEPALGSDGRRRLRASASKRGAALQRRVLPRRAASCRSAARRSASLRAGRAARLARGRARDLRHAAGAGARPDRAAAARCALHAARLCRAAGGATIIEPLREDWAQVQADRGAPERAKGDADGAVGDGASRSTTSSARRACSIRPAAPATSSMCRWS